MNPSLSELIRLSGEENALSARIEMAVDWLAATPEGRDMLEIARARHGPPLTFHTDSTLKEVGYGNLAGAHIVNCNPLVTDATTLLSDTGLHIPIRLERFVAHELSHATRPDMLESAKRYVSRKMELLAKTLSDIPVDAYRFRLALTHNAEARIKIFGEMYDTHIGSQSQKLEDRFFEEVSRDPLITAHLKAYEEPAIRFENHMMQRYFGEPGRTLDYLHSATYETLAPALDRENFIASAMEASGSISRSTEPGTRL